MRGLAVVDAEPGLPSLRSHLDSCLGTGPTSSTEVKFGQTFEVAELLLLFAGSPERASNYLATCCLHVNLNVFGVGWRWFTSAVLSVLQCACMPSDLRNPQVFSSCHEQHMTLDMPLPFDPAALLQSIWAEVSPLVNAVYNEGGAIHFSQGDSLT